MFHKIIIVVQILESFWMWEGSSDLSEPLDFHGFLISQPSFQNFKFSRDSSKVKFTEQFGLSWLYSLVKVRNQINDASWLSRSLRRPCNVVLQPRSIRGFRITKLRSNPLRHHRKNQTRATSVAGWLVTNETKQFEMNDKVYYSLILMSLVHQEFDFKFTLRGILIIIFE